MINQKQPQIKNTYKRAVKYEGNINAIQLIQEVFQSDDSIWRGLGSINNSGFTIKEKYAQFDAIKQFDLPLLENKEPQNCQCANILCGKKKPFECPLFKKICTPSNPIGPCMVSSEGACAASYMYD